MKLQKGQLCHQTNEECLIYFGDFSITKGNVNNDFLAGIKCGCGRHCGWLPKPKEGQIIEDAADEWLANQFQKTKTRGGHYK